MSEGDLLGWQREDWPWLLGLLLLGSLTLALFALSADRFTAGQGGVPLDDAWIHFQFARNLARGDGLSFNPGRPTSGSTAPLWTFLLAAVYPLGGFPIAGQVLSGLCFLLTLVATYRLGWRLTGERWAAGLTGAVVAVNGRMVWAGLSALETCLFAWLSLWAIAAHLTDRATGRYRSGTVVLFGLAALSRPEGYLLFALAGADFLYSLWRGGCSARLVLRLFLAASLFVAIVVPYLLFSWYTSGHLLPNTYHAKATVTWRPDWDFVSLAARYLILDNPLLLPCFVLGVGLLFSQAPVLSLWSGGLPLVYAFLHAIPYQHGRYLMPLIPCNAIVGVVGLWRMRRWLLRRRGRWRDLVGRFGVIGVVVVAGTAWRLPEMARLYAWNVDNINQMHVGLGHWVVEHVPAGAVLALNDIGAITYVSEHPVVDLAGLITPEVIPILRHPDRDALLIDLMAERDVEYVIIFPNWFPGLAERDDVLTPIHQVTLERRTIGGGERMVVYQAHW
ncbi:MAG TPA: hypothetical protein ENN99_00135 [Chloroflexi bacterium]|nr:hypothetical protein [Chloroflexota bacterium]